ncbi:MAG: sterol desaturase family protein [Sandaracinus sp.]
MKTSPEVGVHDVLDPREVDRLSSIHGYGEALRVFFSRPGPRLIAKTAGLTWLARAALGPPGLGELATAGLVVAWWPLQEWLAHRHLLHRKPTVRADGTVVDPVFARRHRHHHEHPDEVDATLLPIEVIRGAIPAASGVFLLALGPRRRTLTAMATYSTMALVYEWTHFLVHTSIRPESAFYRKLRTSHRLHHFRNEHYWLGFTLPLVDRWMGTDPDPGSVPHSKTAMDLHGLRAAERASDP